MHQPQVELHTRRASQFGEWSEVGPVLPITRNGHVNPRHRSPRRGDDEVRELDRLAQVYRFDKVLGVHIAVAKVKAELHVGWNSLTERTKSLPESSLHAGERWHEGRTPIPLDHLDADVPLNRQIAVGNRLADALDLAQH